MAEEQEVAMSRGRDAGCLVRIGSRCTMPAKPHALVYRLTGGVIGSRVPLAKLRVLLITTSGRRSGRPRTTPVMYYRDGARLVIVASNSGRDRHPAWYWNLKAHPEAMVQIGREKREVVAREATPEDRARLWPRLTEVDPLYAVYQERTRRRVPVIVLQPPERESSL